MITIVAFDRLSPGDASGKPALPEVTALGRGMPAQVGSPQAGAPSLAADDDRAAIPSGRPHGLAWLSRSEVLKSARGEAAPFTASGSEAGGFCFVPLNLWTIRIGFSDFHGLADWIDSGGGLGQGPSGLSLTRGSKGLQRRGWSTRKSRNLTWVGVRVEFTIPLRTVFCRVVAMSAADTAPEWARESAISPLRAIPL